jgi:hypothetical protein
LQKFKRLKLTKTVEAVEEAKEVEGVEVGPISAVWEAAVPVTPSLEESRPEPSNVS